MGYGFTFGNYSSTTNKWTQAYLQKNLTNLGSGYTTCGPWAADASHVIVFTVSGTSTVTLTVKVDGCTVGTTTDSSSTITSGNPGFIVGRGGVIADSAITKFCTYDCTI